jgi:hypothetical protein
MGENEQLRALHDTYVWDINAAVGEGRLDLVWELADDYLEQAVAMITAGEPAGCGREDCAVCNGTRPRRVGTRRRGWLRRGPRARWS